MPDTDLLTRPEAASLLRVSLRTLDTLIAEGHVPRPTSFGGRRVFFHREQLELWIRSKFGLPISGAAPSEVPESKSGKGRPGRPRKTIRTR